MKIHQIDFFTFLNKTFESFWLGKEDEKRILLFQEWQNDVHKNSFFIELVERKDSSWKIKYSIWKMGEDTFRLLSIMESLKWVGKEIKPSIIEKEIPFTEDEKQSLLEKIKDVKVRNPIDFNFGFKKILKLELEKSNNGFCWNEDNEIEDSIIILISELKNKSFS